MRLRHLLRPIAIAALAMPILAGCAEPSRILSGRVTSIGSYGDIENAFVRVDGPTGNLVLRHDFPVTVYVHDRFGILRNSGGLSLLRLQDSVTVYIDPDGITLTSAPPIEPVRGVVVHR